MVWHLLYPRDEWEGKGWNPLLFYMRHPSVHMHLVGGDGLGIERLMWFTLLTYQVWVLESHLGQENMENGKLKPPSHIEAICTEWIIDFATKIFRHLVDVEECRNPQEMPDLQLSCHLDINQQGCSHPQGWAVPELPPRDITHQCHGQLCCCSSHMGGPSPVQERGGGWGGGGTDDWHGGIKIEALVVVVLLSNWINSDVYRDSSVWSCYQWGRTVIANEAISVVQSMDHKRCMDLVFHRHLAIHPRRICYHLILPYSNLCQLGSLTLTCTCM